MAKKGGIRSYGPGKFYTIVDSYVFGVTLDGGADEEATYPQEGSGWFGLVWLDAPTCQAIVSNAEADGDPLTDEEVEQLETHKAVILFERSDGIVEADWFDNKAAAEAAWAEVLVDTEGDEEDEEDEDEEEEEYE